MADGQSDLRSITKAPDFLACVPDGFTTTILNRPPDAAIQINFWNVDGTPESENPALPHEALGRYRISEATILRAAIRLRPDVGLQLAVNILRALTGLPDEIRIRYGLPKEIHEVQGNQNAK